MIDAAVLDEDVTNVYPDQEGLPCLRHFWCPDTNQGLWDNQTAFARANDFFAMALGAYARGDYGLAYDRLGRVIHLVCDMGVPAHVQLDPHPPIINPDTYETSYIPTHHIEERGIDFGGFGLMTDLAQATDYFDSDDYNGDGDQGRRRAGGFTQDERREIAEVCYPGAIEATGGMLAHFYDTVRPTLSRSYPNNGGKKSGLNGIDFIAGAASYGGGDRMAAVNVYYNLNDDQSGGWISLGPMWRVEKTLYAGQWKNQINDGIVWLRFEAVDNGDVESVSEIRWISIDSTKPVITNTRK